MDEKFCPSCRQLKSLNEYSEKVTVPGQLYRNCDSCRNAGIVRPAKASYRKEVQELRAKAISLRKFDDRQSLELLQANKAGKSIKALSAEHSCSESAVSRAIKRARHLDTA